MGHKKLITALILISFFILFSISVSAQIQVENKTIDFDLVPERISEDTYLPIEKLIDADLFEVDRVNENRYIVLKNNNYYILQTDRKLVRSNLQNRTLTNEPLVLNQHFLVPVEFLEDFLNFRVRVAGGLTMPDRIDRDDQVIAENLRLRVYLNDDDFDRDETLRIRMEIMNIGNSDQRLRFNSAQKYNIYIKNRFGRTIYSWADGKIFSQAVQNIDIKGRDSISLEENIALNRFSEGRYYLEIEILTENYDFSTIERRFEIDD